MTLSPWYKAVTPRPDILKGEPLDASEFAVHLDHIRDQRATEDYQNPERFFSGTFLTKNLRELASQALRRLSGIRAETSAVFDLTTQFGGGKTHALTLLYHLARGGEEAKHWPGVSDILEQAGVTRIPRTATAVFVGTEFDLLKGRGGENGEPRRLTPWGEIAWQLGGEKSFAVVAEHDRKRVDPKGDVIRAFLPPDRPCMILMDEILNFAGSYRRLGISDEAYKPDYIHSFLQNLTQTIAGMDNAVLAISLPASEMEYLPEDSQMESRLKKMLERLARPILLSAEQETSEIIRRRLFDWKDHQTARDGKLFLSKAARETCQAYADWVKRHRTQIPATFPIDHGEKAFLAAYPFHPALLTVFERKWQALPHFQRTRGILRMLALWLSYVSVDDFKNARADALISPGSAPLEDTTFRSAMFEQLGESKLEVAVTSDICGRDESHAIRLDENSDATIKKTRLHRKVATAIFLESNGGQTATGATLPEIRLAVAEPELDSGNVETVLDSLDAACYYLNLEDKQYRFGMRPNLNKLLADRVASVTKETQSELVQNAVRFVFTRHSDPRPLLFPDDSGAIPDRSELTFVVLSPLMALEGRDYVKKIVETHINEHGSTFRKYKNALIWCVPANVEKMFENARKLAAWEAIQDEFKSDTDKLDDVQRNKLNRAINNVREHLKEDVWRCYTTLMFLGRDNKIQKLNLGVPTSSSAPSLMDLYISRLKRDDQISENPTPDFLARKWPAALPEWSTRGIVDAFFSSPEFPRLMDNNRIRETVARGVGGGQFAYVGTPGKDGRYVHFYYKKDINALDVEISEETFIIKKEEAESYQRTLESGETPTPPKGEETPIVKESNSVAEEKQDDGTETVTAVGEEKPSIGRIRWSGSIPPRKWSIFYANVISKFVEGSDVTLNVTLDAKSAEGFSDDRVDEARVNLRDLGLGEEIEIDGSSN